MIFLICFGTFSNNRAFFVECLCRVDTPIFESENVCLSYDMITGSLVLLGLLSFMDMGTSYACIGKVFFIDLQFISNLPNPTVV